MKKPKLMVVETPGGRVVDDDYDPVADLRITNKMFEQALDLRAKRLAQEVVDKELWSYNEIIDMEQYRDTVKDLTDPLMPNKEDVVWTDSTPLSPDSRLRSLTDNDSEDAPEDD